MDKILYIEMYITIHMYISCIIVVQAKCSRILKLILQKIMKKRFFEILRQFRYHSHQIFLIILLLINYKLTLI